MLINWWSSSSSFRSVAQLRRIQLRRKKRVRTGGSTARGSGAAHKSSRRFTLIVSVSPSEVAGARCSQKSTWLVHASIVVACI